MFFGSKPPTKPLIASVIALMEGLKNFATCVLHVVEKKSCVCGVGREQILLTLATLASLL